MKKSRIVHLLVALLALDVTTMGVMGGVYANFGGVEKSATKTVKMEDWGVTINTPINTIEKKSDSGLTLTFPEEIQSLAAPGEVGDPDQNDSVKITITGTPKANIDMTWNTKITVIDPEKWTINADGIEGGFVYFPIRFTMDGEEYKYTDLDSTTEDKVYEYNTSEVLKAGVKYNKTKDVRWEWDYEQPDENGDVAKYDRYDTMLADFENKEDAPSFKVEMTVTLEWTPKSTNTNTTTPDDEESPDTVTSPVTPTINNYNTISGATDGNDGVTEDNRTIAGESGDLQTISGAVTGDSFNFVLWISLMAIAAVVIIVSIVLLFKCNKRGVQDEDFPK